MSTWLMPLLMGLLGAVVGGAGVSRVVRLALTENLRTVFAPTEHTFTKEEVHKEIETRNARLARETEERTEKMVVEFKEAARVVRQEVENIVGPATARIERANVDLKADVLRVVETVQKLAEQQRADMALLTQQQREDGKMVAEAARVATGADERSKGLVALLEQYGERLTHIDNTMTRLSEAVELKRSA